MVGIFYCLIISIWQRKKLLLEEHELDVKKDSPKDYTIKISQIPHKLYDEKGEKLIEHIN
jgi:hypothetical protein